MERRTRSTNKARAVEWIPDGWSAEKFHADAAARLAGVRIDATLPPTDVALLLRR